MKYKYVPFLRPVTFATLPPDIRWDYVEAPADQPLIAFRRGIRLSTHRFGVIVTDREFTPEECGQYGMSAI